MALNLIAEAWRIATGPEEMALPFASPFVFIDNRGNERQCTGLLPHVGSPMGTLIGTHYDPDHDSFIAATRGLDYLAVTLPASFEIYNQDRFVKALKDWGWYGPEHLMPAFFAEPGEQGPQ
jgi:hypothetical protein